MNVVKRSCFVLFSVGFLLLQGCDGARVGSERIDVSGSVGSSLSSGSPAAQSYAAKINTSVQRNKNGFVVNDISGGPANQTYYFAFDNSTIRPEDKQAIQQQANYLIAHPHLKVKLYGNTDNRGSREYNIALGYKRDLSVADLLELWGVQESQIEKVSYGEENPAVRGNNERAWALNRRVELKYEV